MSIINMKELEWDIELMLVDNLNFTVDKAQEIAIREPLQHKWELDNAN